MSSQPTSPILELQRQQLLLQMEYEEEKKAFQEKVDAIGLQRLVAHGDAWWPVRVARSYYNSLNQLCVEVFRVRTSEDDDDQDHNFEFGRPVSFFKNNEAHEPNKPNKTHTPHKTQHLLKGTVSFVDGDRMVVSVPDGAPLADLQQEGVGIQLSFDETSYRMMFDALDRTMRAKGRLAYLRDLFYTRGMRAQTFSFPDMGFQYLNKTQEHAVNEVLRAKDVAIVHGPPGTGKTTTLVEAIYETLRREPQVLVCAQSNMAVDWISEKLVDRGINVLRIGNPVRVDDKMLSFTYERRFEAHPDYPQLWALRKAIRDLRKNRKRSDDKYHQKLERLKDRATALEISINQQLFGEARVIACTLVGAGHRLLDGTKFGTLFIDEAAQALEAACWIPIRRANRVIFAGDHCQLPPTVKCYEALKGGLGRTLMERICDQKPEVVTLLTIQYRMNEEIMRFSSDWFYHNMVQSAPEVKYRSILDLDIPITWINTETLPQQTLPQQTLPQQTLPQQTLPQQTLPQQTLPQPLPVREGSKYTHGGNSVMTPLPHREGLGGESAGGESAGGESAGGESAGGESAGGESAGGGSAGVSSSFSYSNTSEAELTLLALQAYYELIGKERILAERLDVGIISPYRAQVQLIRRLLRKREFFKPFRSLISVNSVDGFQGQERDIIVISMVRSNDEGQIGFLRDLRRMNVAITRARMKLIILGDRHTLCRHPFYRKLWQYVEALKESDNAEKV